MLPTASKISKMFSQFSLSFLKLVKCSFSIQKLAKVFVFTNLKNTKILPSVLKISKQSPPVSKLTISLLL